MYQVDLQHSVNTGYLQPYQIYDKVNQICKKDLSILIDDMIDLAEEFDHNCLSDAQSTQLSRLLNAKRRLIKSTLRYQIDKGFKDFKTGHRLKLHEHRSLKELSNELGIYATSDSIKLLHNNVRHYNRVYAHFLTEQLKCCRTLVHRSRAEKEENPLGINAIFHYFETSIADLGLKPDKTEAVLKLFESAVLPKVEGFYQKTHQIFIEQNIADEAQFDRHQQENKILSTSGIEKIEQPKSNSVNLVTVDMINQSHDSKDKKPSETDENQGIDVSAEPIIAAFITKTTKSDGFSNQFLDLKYQLIESGVTQYSDHCDILSMMFDLIFEDSGTPEQIKHQISRMQYLYFHSAINQKEYFLDNDHPSRVYLDSIQENENLWQDNAELTTKSARFLASQISTMFEQLPLGKIDYTKLLHQYLDHCKKVKNLLTNQKLTPEQIARKLATKEKVLVDVQALLKPLTSDLENIKAVKPIFDQVIEPMLLSVANQHGLSSIPWHQSFNIAQTLVWTLTPKSSTVENQTMASTFFNLLSYLSKAMDALSLSKVDKDHIINILSTEHSKIVALTEQNIKKYTNKDSSTKTEKPADTTNFQIDNEFLHDVKSHRNSNSTPVGKPQGIKIAASIEIGDWMEIKPKGGKPVQAKLTWKAADNSSFIFVDRLGNKVKELNLKTLASEIDKGQIKTIQQRARRKNIL